MAITRWKRSLLVLATLVAAGFSWSAMLDYEARGATQEQHGISD